MKGFKQQPQAARKERLKELEAELANIQMALRVSQMVTQQLMQSNKHLSEDMARYAGMVNELQYKFLAVQKVGNFTTAALDEAANALRLKDFNEASDAEDAEKGYTSAETVIDGAIVILTSTVEGDNEKGLFRSKVSLLEAGPAIQEALLGKRVGEKVEVTLAGNKHLLEILGVRIAPATEAI